MLVVLIGPDKFLVRGLGNNISIFKVPGPNYQWDSGYPFTYCTTRNCAQPPWATGAGGQPNQNINEDSCSLDDINDGEGTKMHDDFGTTGYDYICEVISQ